MWNSVFGVVSSAVSSVWSWFDRLFDSIPGAWAFVFMVILVYLVVTKILAPITGIALRSGISDEVKKEKRKEDLDLIRYRKPK